MPPHPPGQLDVLVVVPGLVLEIVLERVHVTVQGLELEVIVLVVVPSLVLEVVLVQAVLGLELEIRVVVEAEHVVVLVLLVEVALVLVLVAIQKAVVRLEKKRLVVMVALPLRAMIAR